MGVLHGEVTLGKARVQECILCFDNQVTQQDESQGFQQGRKENGA